MFTLEAVLGICTWRVTVPSLCDGHARGWGYLGHSLGGTCDRDGPFLFVCFVFSLRKDPDVSSSPVVFCGKADNQR